MGVIVFSLVKYNKIYQNVIMELAPIVLFVFNRPFHTRLTVEALKVNLLSEKSELIIFSDGPRFEADNEKVNAVREYIRNIDGFKNITVVERESNFGLARSIADGVTDAVNRFGKIIVIEDDLVTHFQFLEYMNNALNKYESYKKVFSITGYSHMRKADRISRLNDTYFLRLTNSWSWATWKDRWDLFDTDLTGWEKMVSDKKLRKSFNYENTYDYFSMVKNQINGEIDSWAIKWYWTVFKNRGLTLYPRYSLVKNIGGDGSGTHDNALDDVNFRGDMKYEFSYTDDILEQKHFSDEIMRNFKWIKRKRVKSYIKRRIPFLFNKQIHL